MNTPKSFTQSQRLARLCCFLPTIFLTLLPMASRAGTVWVGGDTTNLTSAVNNWVGGVAPGSGSALTFSNTSPIGTNITWDFGNGFNPPSITFVSGALGYVLNDPATATLIQLVPSAGFGGITNNSTSNQTFNKEVNVFHNGTKGFNAAAGDLTFGKKVRFRADSLTSGQTNTLEFTGSQNGSITASPAIDESGAPATGAGYALLKTGAGTWTINGGITTSSTTTSLKVTAGTLTLNPGTGNTATMGNVWITGGALNLNSGRLNVASSGGAGNGIGLYVNGGTMTVAGGAVSTTGYLTVNGSGNLTVSSGAVTNNTDLLNAYGTAGTVNLSGSGLMNLQTFRVAHSPGLGIANLNGGTLMLNNFENNGGGTINFNGTTVQAKANQTAFSPVVNTAIVKAGGAIFDSSIYNITVASPLLAGNPSGGLTKLGTGNLTLPGNNTYTNTTIINAGKLVGVTGGSCSNSAVLVTATTGNTAALGVSITNTAMQWTCSSLTINNAGTSSGLDFDFGALTPGTTVAPLNVTNGVTFTTAPTITVHATSLPISAGNGYPLVTWGAGSAPSLAGITLALPSHAVGSLAIVGNTLYLQVTAPPALQPMSWTGGSGTWDVNNSGNIIWQSSDAVATYYQESIAGNDQVIFGNTVGSGGTVTLNTTVSPASVTVTNPTADYTITGSGAIVGSTSLNKQGAGALNLNTANTYTGGTTVGGGTLSLGAAGAIAANTTITVTNGLLLLNAANVVNGSAALTVNGGAVDMNGQSLFVSPLSGIGGTITNAGLIASNTLAVATYAGVITGSGSLTKTGTNTLVLSGVNTLTGSVLINGGALQLNVAGSLSSASSITVTNNAQLIYTSTNSVTNSAPLTLTGNGIGGSYAPGQQNGAVVGSGNGINFVHNGPITLAPTNTGGVVRVGIFGTVATNVVNNVISGSGSLSLWAQGASSAHFGRFFLNTNFTYTGSTTLDPIAANNLTTLGIDNVFPPATALTLGAYATGTFTNYSQLILNGYRQTLSGLSSTANVNNIVTNRITGGSATLSVLTISNNAAAYAFGGVLGGTSPADDNLALVKAGTNMLTLTRANTFTGGTLISGGGLQLGDGVNNGSVPGNITNHGTLTLNLTGVNTVGNQISGSGSLTNSSAGITTLTNLNTFTGGTTLTAGNLVLNSPGVCLASDITIAGGANLKLGAAEQIADTAILSFTTNVTGRFQLQGFNETIGGVQDIAGTGIRIVEAAPDTTNNAPATLTLNVAGAGAYNYSSYVRDAAGAVNSALSITKAGIGTQTFSAAAALVSYSGATVISNGVLEFSGANSVAASSAITTYSGGTVKFSGGGSRSALISGGGNLIDAGVTTLTLSGNNSYTGVTTLSNGTLSVPALSNGGVNSPIGAATSDATNLVFAGGSLYYSSATNTSCDRNFTISGTNTATITVAQVAANVTLTGTAPTTSGDLKKTGNGTLTLDPGAGIYSVGCLSADGGILVLKSGTFTTTGVDPFNPAYLVGAGARGGKLVVDGATLDVTGSGTLKPGTATANGNIDILSGNVNAGSYVLGHNATVTGTQSGGFVSVTNLYHQDSGKATNTITGGVLKTTRIFNNSTVAGSYFTLILNGGIVQVAPGTVNLLDNAGLAGPELIVELGSVGATIDTSLSDAAIVRPLNDLPAQAGQLTKIGSGMLTLASASTYTGPTIISNGILAVAGSLAAGSVVTVNAGGTLAALGSIGGPVTVESSGILAGKGGSINGAVVVNGGGIFAPGNATNDIGTMTINSSLTLNAGSFTFMEINKAGATNDLVPGVSSLTYGGTLTVTNLGGTNGLGDTYQLFSAASYTGDFTATNLPPLDAGLKWNWTPTNGTLTVVSSSSYATTTTNIVFGASSTNLSLTWPASHLGWFAQSNAVDLADPGYWFDIPGSETVTNLDIPIDVALPNVFYRLRMP